MPEPPAFASSIPWDGKRPPSIVVMCVDGRWRPHVQEFATSCLGADPRYDIVAVPGGIEPLTLADLVPKDYNFLRRRLDTVIAAHGSRRIVAVAHQDCAWYGSRRVGRGSGPLRDRQVADLRRAAAILREIYPQIDVETYYARLEEPAGKVVFDRV
jgi:carbonic anhydrase-like protein